MLSTRTFLAALAGFLVALAIAVLPQTAVMADTEGSYVLLVNAAGKVERRAVRVSGSTDSGVIIAAGLTGSERVVATAGGFLRGGEAVQVAPAAAGGS